MTLVEKTKILLLSIFNLLFIGTFSYVFINATVFPNTFVETMNPWVVLIIATVIGLILLCPIFITIAIGDAMISPKIPLYVTDGNFANNHSINFATAKIPTITPIPKGAKIPI